LEKTVVRSMKRGLCARDVVGQPDARTERLFADQQFVVVIANAGIKREVIEQLKSVLHICAQSPTRLPSNKDEWMSRIEVVYGIEEDISSIVYDLVEVNGRIEAEILIEEPNTNVADLGLVADAFRTEFRSVEQANTTLPQDRRQILEAMVATFGSIDATDQPELGLRLVSAVAHNLNLLPTINGKACGRVSGGARARSWPVRYSSDLA